MADETPLFLQYLGIKKEHPNEVLFFRLGDFYEMFNEDAVEVSRILNLTLTHRGDNPMCGIPYHAARVYIARLLRKGKKIAIAEQVGEIAKGKGLTERKVVEIITPGTALESEYLDGGINSFLASFYVKGKKCGFAYVDVTTGEFKATEFSVDYMEENFLKELGRVSPKELLLPQNLRDNVYFVRLLDNFENVSISWYPEWDFNQEKAYGRLLKQFGTVSLNSFSLDEYSIMVPPAGFLLEYLERNTNTAIPHIKSIQVYSEENFLIIDDSSRRNLEITGNLRDGTSQFSLLECVDYSCTAMGSRLVRKWLSFPLVDREAIVSRQNHIGIFYEDRILLKRFREAIGGILDIERLAGRIALDKAHGKDLVALKNSLILWVKALGILGEKSFSSVPLENAMGIIELIGNSILDDPATALTDGRIIRDGWSQDLDHWRDIQNNFNHILDEYAQEERNKTGIQNLRIKNSGNMGYFIEVTKGKLDMVPQHFIIRRALVNADRYTTARLQELEQNLNESATRILELERDLFLDIRNRLKEFVPYLQQLASEIAYSDTAASFAEAAFVNSWTKPELDEENGFIVHGGRHPVVEKHIPSGEFVPNDLELIPGKKQTFALITGPNMAGKSTFLRQNALIQLLAQTGSYVPAEYACISIADRIFCRVGASDNLAKGESTFLVEMTETARILRSSTNRSLVIMDEVGRGTSTEDGLSIAWACSEYLLDRLKCKTLFATHYHELTRLVHPELKLLCMDVSENGRDIVFLRKVISGAAQNSYGIHVARLAGVPSAVTDRAEQLLGLIQKEKEDNPIMDSSSRPDFTKAEPVPAMEPERASFTGALFSDEELILDEILSCDTNNMTPMDALKRIAAWKHSLSGR